MKKITVLVLLVLSVSLYGGSRVLNTLKASRLKKIKIEESKKEADLKRIKAEYIKKLEELKKVLTKKGDLDAALAVQAEIQAVKQRRY